ncbi:MAG: S8 family serine peptidase, partial [Elusimicrobia bacterium]|nr:S8 family serine peptidase [Elusimicrobiota bacterium]
MRTSELYVPKLRDPESGAPMPNDPYFSSYNSWGQDYRDMWGLEKINAEGAWGVFKSPKDIGKGVVVAVSDTGVDYNHPDIATNIWKNPGEIPGNGIDDDGNGFIDDDKGWDFVTCNTYDDFGCIFKDPDNDPLDEHGHGTHVAGTISAASHNGIGITGIAWQSKIMPVRGLNKHGSGYYSELINGVLYAVENGADVINMSWGGYYPSGIPDPMQDVVDYAHSLGVVLVVAAGNSGADVSYFTPAKFDNVIKVGASNHDDL